MADTFCLEYGFGRINKTGGFASDGAAIYGYVADARM